MGDGSKRIDYFDGLKGVAALMVFLYHLAIIAFYNGYLGYGSPYINDPDAAKDVIFSNFWAVIYSNNCIGICLFFILISVFPVISYRNHNDDAAVMGKAAIKRYFQLLIPCFFVTLINVILFWNGLLLNESLAQKINCNWLFKSLPYGFENIPEFLYTIFISIWFTDSRVPLSPLWCMYIIFLGSLAVYAVYALTGKSKFKYLPCVVLAVISLFFPFMSYFAIGSFLTEFLCLNPERKSNKFVTLIMLLVGLALIKIPNQLYPFTVKSDYSHGIGAGLVIWAVLNSSILKKILSCKCLVFLGKISFEIILVHFVLLSTLGCLVYEWIMKYTSSSYIRLAVCFLSLLPFTVLFSFIINKFICKPANTLLKKAVDRLF